MGLFITLVIVIGIICLMLSDGAGEWLAFFMVGTFITFLVCACFGAFDTSQPPQHKVSIPVAAKVCNYSDEKG